MTPGDIIGNIITGIVMLIMLVMSIMLMMGKGANLIAGYNTMSEKEKARYDSTALCKCVGKYLLSITVMMAALPLGGILQIDWLPWVFTAYVFISTIVLIIYCNTGNRFKK